MYQSPPDGASFHGLAYIPQLIPQGVQPEHIR